MIKRLYILFLIPFSLLLSPCAYAQLKSGEFAIGGKLDEWAGGIVQTEDGGFAISGTYFNDADQASWSNISPTRMYLVKLDSMGRFKWDRLDSGNCMGHGLTVITNTSTDQQNIVTIGDYMNSGSYYAMIDCFDLLGNSVWSKQIYGLSSNASAYPLTHDRNNNIIIIGCDATSQSSNDGGIDIDDTILFGFGGRINLYGISSSGNLNWSTVISDTTIHYPLYPAFTANGVTQVRDGGFVVTGGFGYYNTHSGFFVSGLLVKVDSLGNLEWEEKFKGTDSIGTSICSTKDRGIIITGAANAASGGDFFVEKFDSTYKVQWEKLFTTPNTSQSFSIIQTLDGGYALTGYCLTGTRNYDVYMAKLDGAGNLLWDKVIGGKALDEGRAIVQAQQPWDKGFAIAGVTSSFGYRVDTTRNIYFVKLDSTGNSCNALPLGASITNGSNTVTNLSLIQAGSMTVNPGDNFFTKDSIITVCTNYTGIENVFHPYSKVIVYPNPIITEALIDFGEDGKHYLELNDITGRVIEQMECNGRQYELKRKNLTTGIYLLKVYDESREFVANLKLEVL